MTKGKSVRTFKLGPFQFPDAYLRGYAPRTFSKCFTFACFCKKSKGLLNPLITVHYFFFVCLYVCNRGDTYYSFTASSRQGSLAKPLSLRSLLRSLIVKLLNRQYFPRKTGLQICKLGILTLEPTSMLLTQVQRKRGIVYLVFCDKNDMRCQSRL